MHRKSQALAKNSQHTTTISLDYQPFIALIKVKRSDLKRADNIRVSLSSRRSRRVHYFLKQYAAKITLVNVDTLNS
ncbi:hypothetical protein AADZ84_05880 [Colwelliaceae bacterium MEBiC 14330]